MTRKCLTLRSRIRSENTTIMEEIMSENIELAVRSRYGSVATSKLSSEHEGVRVVAEAFGYTPADLASIPAEANMGLSCGNPTPMANLREASQWWI